MRALVTGGGGFLGRAVLRGLAPRGWDLRSLARHHYAELDVMGVAQHQGDLADAAAVEQAVAGCDVVFHVAAKAGIWGPEREYHNANVVGTQNVLDACRRHRVPKLVYTSTPSVVHGGTNVSGVDESAPYPERFAASYPRTKAEAERRVLAANSSELATVALRPHLIWGPEDNHLVPKIVARHRSGRLRLVGDGSSKVDSVYIDNAAAAHLLAADRLEPGARCAGRPYFISQGQPTTTAELINGIVQSAGLRPVDKTIPLPVAWVIGACCEAVYGLLRITSDPPMTRFLARQLATDHWYDIAGARRDLGYEPEVSLDEGFARLRRWFRDRDVA